MSLADELLADLEEAAGEEEEAEGSEGGEEPPIEDVREEPEPPEGAESVRSIAKLWGSKGVKTAWDLLGPVEAAPEYRVIVDANNLTVEIENELNIIHKFIRDKYSKRFPELESLVPNALDYIRTVKVNGRKTPKNGAKTPKNGTKTPKNGTKPPKTGQNHQKMGQKHQKTGQNPKKRDKTPKKWDKTTKKRVPVSFIAPNLSLILGASTAAKIMGVAGGLTPLSKLPACNILLDIVQSLPPDLRRKAARLVAAKCTLAARVDSFHESQDGKEEIERKFDKWQEPPPVKQVKPLPPLIAPRLNMQSTPKYYRKMKESLGLTEIRKQANRMSFGEIEEDAYQEDLGFSLGHLGKAGSGRVRQTQVNEATKARISKTLQRTLQKQSMVYGGKSTIRDRSSGTASSVAFTPLQVGRGLGGGLGGSWGGIWGSWGGLGGPEGVWGGPEGGLGGSWGGFGGSWGGLGGSWGGIWGVLGWFWGVWGGPGRGFGGVLRGFGGSWGGFGGSWGWFWGGLGGS
uniref:U4/U6 small nuclear ribonucleoprotein Prp31 n=1 Tax=Geospiza parvula TaxID=87175 RepID=A0A8U8C5J3_GEOPR